MPVWPIAWPRALRQVTDAGGRVPLIGDDDGGELFPIAGHVPDDVRPTLAWAAWLLGRQELAMGDGAGTCAVAHGGSCCSAGGVGTIAPRRIHSRGIGRPGVERVPRVAP